MKIYITTLAALLFSIVAGAQSKDFKTAQTLEIQYNILNELKARFVDSIDTQKLINTGINAMLESLDPYTEYIPAENDEELELMTTATYGGIGSLIKKVDSVGVIISQPYLASPAIKYGLEPGDVILKIDGEDVAPLTADQCSSKMKGQPGTEVVFTVKKARGGEIKDYKITRERIHIPDVSFSGMINDKYSNGKKVGYIKLDGFTANGSKDVKSALISLKNEGAERIILDLRGNGGGLMDEAIKILLPTREFDAVDLVKDCIGVAIAVGIVILIRKGKTVK